MKSEGHYNVKIKHGLPQNDNLRVEKQIVLT